MIAKTLAKNSKIDKVRTAFLGKTTSAVVTARCWSGFCMTVYTPDAPLEPAIYVNIYATIYASGLKHEASGPHAAREHLKILQFFLFIGNLPIFQLFFILAEIFFRFFSIRPVRPFFESHAALESL